MTPSDGGLRLGRADRRYQRSRRTEISSNKKSKKSCGLPRIGDDDLPRISKSYLLGGVVYNLAIAWPLFRRFVAKNT
jgi:hypothetical protein